MTPISQLILPIALMIALIILGMVVFVWIRRRYLDDPPEDPGSGLTLHSIRTLKAEGKLSEEEFQKARALILGQAGADQSAPTTPDHNPDSHPDP